MNKVIGYILVEELSGSDEQFVLKKEELVYKKNYQSTIFIKAKSMDETSLLR